MVKRFRAILFLLLLAAWPAAAQSLSLADVQTVIAQAVTRAIALPNPLKTNAVIALTDREGWVLGVWALNTNITSADPLVGEAIAKAGTAAFLSSDNNAFTSRTAGFIVQQHFPPGVANTPPGPLVGVNFSQLAFSDINKFKGPGSVISYGSSPGLTLVPTPLPITGGLEGTPGGVPLYKNGHLVGGVGIAGNGVAPTGITPALIAGADSDEDVALAAQTGYQPSSVIFGSGDLVNGIRLEYVESTTSLGAVLAFGSLPGQAVTPYALITTPPPFPYPVVTLGGEAGELRQPLMDDPSGVPLPGDGARLTAMEVSNVLVAAANRCRTTRAGIRLPRGQAAQVFITVVNNPNSDGVAPVVLGTFCTSSNATRFSWDVAVQKARTAVFFSATNRAYSARTVGFLAQNSFPPGISGTQPGLFFGLQERFSIITPTPIVATNPVNGAVFTTSTNVNPNLPNGITIFPGGFPIYRNGSLIGAVGVSGDGIDQDDLVAATGASLFLPPVPIRADQTQYRGARLPFAKFPRNPAL
ncbi:MAG: heme-binding protein [Verrucomicrobia bacterium]|nr:heme-binding protein [Verrucomicrobiota bacterium]